MLSCLALLALTPAAHAGWFCDSREKIASSFEPYLETSTDPHATQWRREPWKVTDWTDNPAAARAQMDFMFRSGIFTRYQDASSIWSRNDTLTVGPSFYHLSGFDKRRAVELFDHMYQVTANAPATLFLRDNHTDELIGVYTRAGLQLQ